MIGSLVSFKRRFPGIWRVVEKVNGVLFRCRYGRIDTLVQTQLDGVAALDYRFALLEEADVPELERFLCGQDPDYVTWFHPHSFDRATLETLWKNPSFVMMKVTDPSGGELIGYFFLRCFFIGRAFAGLIVDKTWQGRGIGASIWNVCALICSKAGLKMQATISSENKASLASCRKGAGVKEVRDLGNDYVVVECS